MATNTAAASAAVVNHLTADDRVALLRSMPLVLDGALAAQSLAAVKRWP